MNWKFVIGLSVICSMGIGLRTFKLTSTPPYLSNDEISVAYDAYSIAYSGRDEHGHLFPVSFESMGNRKAPMYSYLAVVPIVSLGNTDMAAKLPSVILGSLTLFVVGVLGLRLTKSRAVGLIAATVLATSPWHIFDSRKVLEANVGLFFLGMGIVLFVTADSKNDSSAKKWIVLTGLFLAASAYAYHTQWVLAPLLVGAMAWRMGKKVKKLAVTLLVTFAIGFTPLVINYLQYPDRSQRATSEVDVSSIAVQKYLEYTNPGYLFFTGLDLFNTPNPYESGLLLWPNAAAMLVGIAAVKTQIGKKWLLFFIFWVLVSPIVAALTKGHLHQMRNLVTIIPYSILIAIGWRKLYLHVPITTKTLIVLAVGVFGLFYGIYLTEFPRTNAESYQGYKQVADFLSESGQGYSEMYLDTRYGSHSQYVGVPQYYFGYYLKLTPKVFQNRHVSLRQTDYGKYKVSELDWKNVSLVSDAIYLVPTYNPPLETLGERIHHIKRFNDSNQKAAFDLWAYK